jgi:hypothetical protein
MKKRMLLLRYLKFSNILNCLRELEELSSANIKERKRLLSTFNDCVIDAISELALNCLKGNIPLKSCDFKKLKKYQNILRIISQPNKVTTRRNILIQKGGFLNILVGPALSLLAALVGEYIGKRISK